MKSSPNTNKNYDYVTSVVAIGQTMTFRPSSLDARSQIPRGLQVVRLSDQAGVSP